MVKRVCVCHIAIVTEPDPPSVAHALRVHYAQPEHQEVVQALERLEAGRPTVDVAIRNGWAGVTAGLRRVS